MLARVVVLVGVVMLAAARPASSDVTLQSPQVEYRTTPLGLDVVRPRFSWRMAAGAGERAVAQAAYRIEVRDPAGSLAWDSGRREDDRSLAIPYAGTPLRPATRYTWTATAWTRDRRTLATTSWFETGLMDPSPTSPAWGGARWIGGGNDDLVQTSTAPASATITTTPGSPSTTSRTCTRPTMSPHSCARDPMPSAPCSPRAGGADS
jgi:alpha-L-rhamnosidase